MFNKTPII